MNSRTALGFAVAITLFGFGITQSAAMTVLQNPSQAFLFATMDFIFAGINVFFALKNM